MVMAQEHTVGALNQAGTVLSPEHGCVPTVLLCLRLRSYR